jgi:5-methylcytosine-specific restriction endonuclease McrA
MFHKLTRYEADARRRQRERERYNTDPAFWAARKALKLRRTRAQRATQIQPVALIHVAERDGWRCAICAGVVTRATWSLDHVIPLSKGGPHTYSNVVLAHRSCNSSRGAGRFDVRLPDLKLAA